MAKPDYRRARWYGASSNNYGSANRESSHNINKVIIHVVQGPFSAAINTFKDPNSRVSAHYTVRSNDGFIGQSVQEKDIGYHAGNYSYNTSSIGIEHEGYVSQPRYFTAEMYRSSARLTAVMCRKYNIPIDRQHIIGHNEVPGATHTDPGRYWDWPRYMRLVRKYASGGSVYRQVVDNASKRFRAGNAWGVSSYSSQRLGKNYRYANPARVHGFASFRIRIPKRGKYAVFARWPANSGYNSKTRFKIRTANGWVTRVRNQRKNGGKWVNLGTFVMAKGDRRWVRISRKTGANGYVIADAVLVKKV